MNGSRSFTPLVFGWTQKRSKQQSQEVDLSTAAWLFLNQLNRGWGRCDHRSEWVSNHNPT